jgi:small subunit ribosomal protein S6
VTRNYELTFIVKPDIDATNLTALHAKVKDLITTEGGSIVKQDQWGMRRLMYPIRKYREGQYTFMLLQLEAASIARIEARLHLNEDIIRYLLIRADDDLPVVAEPEAAQVPVEASTPAPAATDATPETATP